MDAEIWYGSTEARRNKGGSTSISVNFVVRLQPMHHPSLTQSWIFVLAELRVAPSIRWASACLDVNRHRNLPDLTLCYNGTLHRVPPCLFAWCVNETAVQACRCPTLCISTSRPSKGELCCPLKAVGAEGWKPKADIGDGSDRISCCDDIALRVYGCCD